MIKHYANGCFVLALGGRVKRNKKKVTKMKEIQYKMVEDVKMIWNNVTCPPLLLLSPPPTTT